MFGLTAYNNVQVLSVAPGTATFDVLSDEFSPYATIIPNNTTAPIQNTSLQMINCNLTTSPMLPPSRAPAACSSVAPCLSG